MGQKETHIYIYLYLYVVLYIQGLFKPHTESFVDRKLIFTIFHYCTHGINAISPKMLKHCQTITEEGGILILQKLFYSTYDLISVFKMVITNVI